MKTPYILTVWKSTARSLSARVNRRGFLLSTPDMVQSVDFSTGGFSAAYGDKMSSVLDITYRQPEAFEGAVSASLMGGSVTIRVPGK